MPLHLTDTQREIQALAREFAQGQIAPNAERWNRDHHVPVELFGEMGRLGLLGITIPEPFGGMGLGYLELALVIEEVARADAGISAGLAAQNSLAAMPIVRAGTADQHARFLPSLASGERLGAYALTEPDVGSDTANLKTTATETSTGFTIRGSKMWITNGGFADIFIVYARTDGPGAKGISAFICDGGPGLVVGREIPKLGLHTSSTVELSFDDLAVDADRLLGGRGDGLNVALGTLDGGRIVVAAQAVGIAQAALDLATTYATQRIAFGGPIARFQGVQFPMADVAAKLEAARVLTYHVARMRDRGLPHSAEGAKAKLFASSVAVEAADMAVQTLGGYGYSAEFPAERYYRDAKITEIYEGTSQIQRLVIARHLLGDAARG